MDRRDFLKTSSTFLAATAFPGVPALSLEPLAPGRVNMPINRGWRYSPRKVEGAQTVEFDDSAFEQVVIPHTNVLLPWHSFDDKIYEFVSTYRRRFKTPSHWRMPPRINRERAQESNLERQREKSRQQMASNLKLARAAPHQSRQTKRHCLISPSAR